MALSSGFSRCMGRITNHRMLILTLVRHQCSKSEAVPFNEELLKVLVCPLTKQPLRYDKDTNELISDSVGVAYPVKNGIPNLVPQDGRMLKGGEDGNNTSSHT